MNVFHQSRPSQRGVLMIMAPSIIVLSIMLPQH